MTGETICDLLKPLIGKSGTVFMVVSRIGQVGFASTESNKLTAVAPPRRADPDRAGVRLDGP